MPNLLSDKPIASEEEDVFGLTSFADALAKSLSEMAPDEGIVISVEGEWGTGKTSAIQLTQRRLIIRELARELSVSAGEIEKRQWSSIEADWNRLVETRRTHIVRFNPWNFSGQDNLIRAFFSEVGATIGHPPDGPVSKAINKITAHLPNAGTVLGGIVGGVSSSGAATGAGATVGRAVDEAAARLLGPSGSLESDKRELAEALRKAGKRIVVIIDDLDRLLPSEMRAMFSLVKSLGDLPNILYVLSFDPKAVSQALQNGAEAIDPNFLEKIIQVSLKLPPAWDYEVRRLLFQRIDAIIGEAKLSDVSRWQNSFRHAIAPYIQSPRDVARLANILQVIWPNVEGDVDLTDLVLLTTLQLFEPNIYEMVFEGIEKLSGETVIFEDDKIYSARYEPKNANRPEAAKQALAYLFPKLARGWNVHTWDGVVYLKQREQRRISTREYYRNYFLFGRDPDRVSRVDIETALNSQIPLNAVGEIVERLSNARSRKGMPRVGAFLEQLFEIVFAKPLLSDAVVRALLDLSDSLILRQDIVWELFTRDNFERLGSILVFGLEPLALEERIKRVQTIATHGSGLNLSASVVDRLAGQHGLYGHQGKFENERLVPLAIVEQAVADVTARICEAAERDRLLAAPEPMRLLWTWVRWRSSDDVARWLKSVLENEESVIRLAEKLPSISYRSAGDGQKMIRSFKAETYSQILEVATLKRRIEQIAS